MLAMGGTEANTIYTGGTEILLSGGASPTAPITPAGLAELSVASGGIAVSVTVMSGGTELISSGGTAIDTVTSAGGTAIVLSGASAVLRNRPDFSGITFSGGTGVLSGDVTVSGAALSGIGMAVLLLSSGSVASGAVIGSGGTEMVLAGASEIDAQVGS